MDGEEIDTASVGAVLIVAERNRQISEEGWTPEHDAEHTGQALARAAACYAMPHDMRRFDAWGLPHNWPWGAGWKPTPDDRVRELTKAGALIAAEIDRLQAQEAGR